MITKCFCNSFNCTLPLNQLLLRSCCTLGIFILILLKSVQIVALVFIMSVCQTSELQFCLILLPLPFLLNQTKSKWNCCPAFIHSLVPTSFHGFLPRDPKRSSQEFLYSLCYMFICSINTIKSRFKESRIKVTNTSKCKVG